MSAGTYNKVIVTNIEDEMKRSYIDYAMSVIVSRALPDVRDGFKPVHRRIMYAMHELGMTGDKPYKKSARVVGEVLGKYHPHAETSVYDAVVRLAQDFTCRYPLVDGHGNFGSIDGDAPAAMRYTEVRMSPLAAHMLEDIRKDTVDFVPNFDESLKEPTVLPSRFPNLLANGSSGIAVGMATNIPPHNLGELIDGLIALLDNEELTVDEICSKYVKGPDFPTGGKILGSKGIREAYRTGRSVIRIRAKDSIEDSEHGKKQIVITEIPYQVSKARLIEKIAELVRNKRLDGITDIRDETDRSGMRIVIELRRDVNPQVVRNRLYRYTPLEQTFGIIMLALADGYPRTMNLKEMMLHYLNHQREVVTRRTKYDLAKAEERQHILLGLLIALDHIDAVIDLIRSSRTVDDARQGLMSTFSLSERQAQAILEMRLQRLAGLERKKIEDEHEEVRAAIERYRQILADRQLLDGIVREELQHIKNQFADARRTTITSESGDFSEEDLIQDSEVIITLSADGYIKRQSLAAYKRQLRGGRGVQVQQLKEGDNIEHLLSTTAHRPILFFTSRGRAYRTKAYTVPEFGRQARGMPIANVIALGQDESIVAMVSPPPEAYERDMYIVLATRRGKIKKMNFELLKNVKRSGLNAIDLTEGDDVVAGVLTDGKQDLLLATKHGRALRFSESDVRPMGRTARGVKGITLKEDDEVICLLECTDEQNLLVVSERGYGKRTPLRSFRRLRRGGQGVRAMRLDDKTGRLAVAAIAKPGADLLLVTCRGVIIRINVDQATLQGRQARGVTLMRPEADDYIVAGRPVVEANDGDEEA